MPALFVCRYAGLARYRPARSGLEPVASGFGESKGSRSSPVADAAHVRFMRMRLKRMRSECVPPSSAPQGHASKAHTDDR
jgi:hypothetical protein